MKRTILLFLIFAVLLAGCAAAQPEQSPQPSTTVDTLPVETTQTQPTEAARIISPLPDPTMDNLTDAILAVSLEEGNAYVDDTGKMQMDLTIYSYDRYDMVDIAGIRAGDIIVRLGEQTEVVTVIRSETGTVHINGGLENDGFDLVTEDDGIFFERGYNDHKNWYEVGQATIPVSADLEFHDCGDLELGEQIFYSGSFLIGEVTNYDFTPYNTTVRVDSGEIVEMQRRYIP